MKRRYATIVVLGLLLFSLSSLVSRNDSSGFSYKGFPFAYTKSIDTHGSCMGFNGETTFGGMCGVRTFPIDYKNLILDAIVWIFFSLVLLLVVFKLHKRKV